MSSKRYVIIVAAGKGTRMGADIPKQFIEINGLPILMHTITKFNYVDNAIEIILVLPSDQKEQWKELCTKHTFSIKHSVISGGETRFDSVKNGLASITEKNSVVAIHDGVRPFVSEKTIATSFDIAQQNGNAVPTIAVSDSVRIDENGHNKAIDRTMVKLIQTPQCFSYEIINSAYQQAYSELFTDDASVVEKAGYAINLVEGNKENIKITTSQDLVLANFFLTQIGYK